MMINKEIDMTLEEMLMAVNKNLDEFRVAGDIKAFNAEKLKLASMIADGENNAMENGIEKEKAISELAAEHAQTILEKEHEGFDNWKLKKLASGSLAAFGDNFSGYMWRLDGVPMNSNSLCKVYQKEVKGEQ